MKHKSPLLSGNKESDRDYLTKLGVHCVEQAEKLADGLEPRFQTLDRFERRWRGDFRDRIGGLHSRSNDNRHGIMDDIFLQSNLSLNICRGQVRYMSAKVADELFGSRPWLSVKDKRPTGFADYAQKYFATKLEEPEAAFEESVNHATKYAFAMGVGVLKAAWKRDEALFEEVKNVAIGADGGPIRFADGTYATDEMPVVDREDGQYFEADTYEEHKVNPENITYRQMAVPRNDVRYDGVMAKHIHYRNFLHPIHCTNLDESPFVAEKIDFTVRQLRQIYGQGLITKEQFSKVVVEALENPRNEDVRADEQREQDTPISSWISRSPGEYIPCYECYFDYLPPGLTEEQQKMAPYIKLYALVTAETNEVLYADYLANVVRHGRIPYTVLTSEKLANRLYGPGMYEKYENEADVVDGILNEFHIRNQYVVNPMIVVQRNAFEEIDAGEKLNIGPGKTLTARGTAEISNLIHVVQLFPQEEDTKYLAELIYQQISMDSGVNPAVQGDIGALPQMHTATGVKQVLSHGNVLSKMPTREIQRGVSEFLTLVVENQLWRMGPTEIEEFFPGEEGGGDENALQLFEENRQGDLQFSAQLMMTRFKEAEEMQAFREVAEVLAQWDMMPPPIQEARQSYFADRLEDLGVENAIDLLPIIQDPMGMGAGGMEPMAGEGEEEEDGVPLEEEVQNPAAGGGTPNTDPSVFEVAQPDDAPEAVKGLQ